jgi:hypothetical protein
LGFEAENDYGHEEEGAVTSAVTRNLVAAFAKPLLITGVTGSGPRAPER